MLGDQINATAWMQGLAGGIDEQSRNPKVGEIGWIAEGDIVSRRLVTLTFAIQNCPDRIAAVFFCTKCCALNRTRVAVDC